ADLRSTLEVDRLTAIRAPLNLTPTTPRTAELRPKIANASHLQHLDPMQACKILYALSSRVVNCRNPNCHCGVLQLAHVSVRLFPEAACRLGRSTAQPSAASAGSPAHAGAKAMLDHVGEGTAPIRSRRRSRDTSFTATSSRETASPSCSAQSAEATGRLVGGK